MTSGSISLDELETESKCELSMSCALLSTDFIGGVAWHSEQAFEKATTYGYGRFRIEVLGVSTSSVADKTRHEITMTMKMAFITFNPNSYGCAT